MKSKGQVSTFLQSLSSRVADKSIGIISLNARRNAHSRQPNERLTPSPGAFDSSLAFVIAPRRMAGSEAFWDMWEQGTVLALWLEVSVAIA